MIQGDADAQQAVRFAIYHLTSVANPEDERVSIGARALTGPAYMLHSLASSLHRVAGMARCERQQAGRAAGYFRGPPEQSIFQALVQTPSGSSIRLSAEVAIETPELARISEERDSEDASKLTEPL